MAETQKITLKINNAALQKRYGESVVIEADKNGTPLKRYWRSRLRDAKLDSCVEVVAEKKAATKSKTTEGDK